MNSRAFRQEAIGKAVRSAGQNNINGTKMRQIKIPLPSVVDQKRFVAEIEVLERAIAVAPARKQAIMQRYL